MTHPQTSGLIHVTKATRTGSFEHHLMTVATFHGDLCGPYITPFTAVQPVILL